MHEQKRHHVSRARRSFVLLLAAVPFLARSALPDQPDAERGKTAAGDAAANESS